MAYDMYFGDILMPVTPDAIQMKINGKNETIELINEREINVLKLPGLTSSNFSLLLPAHYYPFARYLSGFQKPRYYLDYFEKLKVEKTDFQWIVARNMPNRNNLHNTNMRVVLEDYTIKENAKNQGFDIIVDIKLKQFLKQETKTFSLPTDSSPSVIQNSRGRSTGFKKSEYKEFNDTYSVGNNSNKQNYNNYNNYSVAIKQENSYKLQIPGMGVVNVTAGSPAEAIAKAVPSYWTGSVLVNGVSYDPQTGKQTVTNTASGTGSNIVTNALQKVGTAVTNIVTASVNILQGLFDGAQTARTNETRQDSTVTVTNPPTRNIVHNQMVYMN